MPQYHRQYKKLNESQVTLVSSEIGGPPVQDGRIKHCGPLLLVETGKR